MKAQQNGFATAVVLVLLVLSIVAGTFILKNAKHRSGASGNYFQARSAELAAQAGLQAGLATLEANPADAVTLLNNYLADTNKAWLFNGVAGAATRKTVNLGTQQQKYAARIIAFDPVASAIKLRAEGEGPGGSESRTVGAFKLDGLVPQYPDLARYGWYVAGEARNVDQRVDVTGDVYFGGDVHFNGGADGSQFHGTFKSAAGAGNTSSFDAQVTFHENAYFETPIKTQGKNLIFLKHAGFASNLSVDADMRLTAASTAYLNGNINAGNAKLDMQGGTVMHSGNLNTARVINAAGITNTNAAIPIATQLQMNASAESELSVDITAVPLSKRFTLSSLGIGAWGSTHGIELSTAYVSAKASGKLYKDFLVLIISSPVAFASIANNTLAGKFVFEVSNTITVNGNLPVSDPASVSLYHVVGNGQLQGFGGTGLFRGYVNVSGNGNVIYQWGAGTLISGAIHHVSATTGFQMNNTGALATLQFEKGVFDELAPLGILALPGAPAAPATPQVKLADTRIRPRFISSYF